MPQDVDVALSNDFISGIALWHFNDFKVDNCGSKWPCPWGGQENNTHCEYDHAPPTTFEELKSKGAPNCTYIKVDSRPGGENHKGSVDFWRRPKPAFAMVASKYARANVQGSARHVESWRLGNATSSPFADGTSVGASPPAPSAAATAVPTVEIAPGVLLPMVTLGGVNSTDYPSYPDYSNYSLWLELGGRGFDSAWEYRTQATVAKAMVASGVPREQLFLTTKIPGSLHGGCCGCPGAGPAGTCLTKCHGVCFPAHGHYTAENATSYIHQNLKILLANGIEYIDLLLLHEPCDYIAPYPYNASAETSDVYGAMEAALLSTDPALMGRIKSIGVSNFNSRMLTLLAVTNKVKPAVNQCRMTVGGYDAATHAYCRQHGITYQAYSTLHGKIDDPAVSTIATAHSVTNAQVVMRWVTQLGVPLVTASENAKYDREDMGIFDFELSQAEMETLTAI